MSQKLVSDGLKSSYKLHRTPSLPTSLGKFDGKCEVNEEEEEEDEEEPRMGDLIRQAMPIMSNTSRGLDRMSSLPPPPLCRGGGSEVSSIVSRGRKCGNLGTKVSVETPALVQEKGPLAMARLSRTTSSDSSMLLPPKSTSIKGTKQGVSCSKNKKLGPSNLSSPARNDQPKTQTLDWTESRKSPTDLRSEELQGFKDLGFSVDDNEKSPRKALRGLQRGLSLDSRRVGPKSSSALADPNDSSSQDVKAQIKFWARAVASNVRSEC